MRAELCEEALRLGRILAELAPGEPEVHGLVALMEIQASRLGARVGADGEPVLLLDQDRTRWDRLLIGPRPGGARTRPSSSAARSVRTRCRPRSPPVTRAPRRRRTPTGCAIAALYDALAQLAPSPVVELNRAVAVAMAFGPAGGARARRRARTASPRSGLPPAAERARRPARPARSLRGGARRARARSIAHAATRASAGCCWTAPGRARGRRAARVLPNPLQQRPLRSAASGTTSEPGHTAGGSHGAGRPTSPTTDSRCYKADDVAVGGVSLSRACRIVATLGLGPRCATALLPRQRHPRLVGPRRACNRPDGSIPPVGHPLHEVVDLAV